MDLPTIPKARRCYGEDLELFEVVIPTDVSKDAVTDLAYLFNAMAKADLQTGRLTVLKTITSSYDIEEKATYYEVVVPYV